MKCPKCGYVSFDSNLECPKCRADISMEQSKLNLPFFKEFAPGDQTPEDELVEGLEDLEKVAGSRETQKRKRQL
jgi:ssDNA-binding Zn-finger/Zn-ribbon topoisomerase 1